MLAITCYSLRSSVKFTHKSVQIYTSFSNLYNLYFFQSEICFLLKLLLPSSLSLSFFMFRHYRQAQISKVLYSIDWNSWRKLKFCSNVTEYQWKFDLVLIEFVWFSYFHCCLSVFLFLTSITSVFALTPDFWDVCSIGLLEFYSS